MDARRTEGCQVILINDRGEVLLQLRDDLPTIPYPGMWAIPGGMLEAGETPLACVVREMDEELGVRMDPATVTHLATRERSYGIEHTFRARVNVAAEEIRLTEGQRVAWFSASETARMHLAYEDGAVLGEFLA